MNENRGCDQKGYESNVTMNTGHINRQKAADTPYDTVDGEGILMQAWCGNNGIRIYGTKNNLSRGSMDYLAYYNLFNVEYNQLIVSINCRLMYSNQRRYEIISIPRNFCTYQYTSSWLCPPYNAVLRP